jgi:hypothetical protein
MICDDCEDARRGNPRSNAFTASCYSCNGRAFASIGAHLESQAAGAMTADYRAALEKVFGAAWADGHRQVKAWASRIDSYTASRKAAPKK